MSERKPGPAWAWLLSAWLVACGAAPPGPVSLEEVEGPYTWGGVDNVTRVRHL